MPRPAGYDEEDWEECDQCEGIGHFEGKPWGPITTYTCSNCDGVGGWPANARRFDLEADRNRYELGIEL